MRIVFFGTTAFSVTILQALINSNHSIVGIVTKEDKPQKRFLKLSSPPVKEWALNMGLKIPIYQPIKAYDPQFIEEISHLRPDLFVVVAYGQILKKKLLDIPAWGCVNVHTSLLPKYRGAAPIQRSVMAGDTTSGVTIMLMDEGMDTGPILKQRICDVLPEMTAGNLSDKLAGLAVEPLMQALQDLLDGKAELKTQNHALATQAPKVQVEDAKVTWNMDCLLTHCQIKGCTPEPGAWCWVLVRGEKKRLKILQADPKVDMLGKKGSIISYQQGCLAVACAQGALELKKLQLEGKKEIEADAFMRGYSQSSISFLVD